MYRIAKPNKMNKTRIIKKNKERKSKEGDGEGEHLLHTMSKEQKKSPQ